MGIPTRAPSSFFAGDTVKWIEDQPDYRPADGWTLYVNLTSASGNYSATSANNGDGRHLVTFATTDTAAIVPGDYTLTIAAVKNGERYTLRTGSITVRPNLQSAADGRSHVKKTLDAIEAYLENPNNLSAASYSVAGRTLSRIPVAELLTLQSRYRKLWRDEQNAERINAGLKSRRRLLTRMSA